MATLVSESKVVGVGIRDGEHVDGDGHIYTCPCHRRDGGGPKIVTTTIVLVCVLTVSGEESHGMGSTTCT